MSEATVPDATRHVLRFGRADRTLHGFLMFSFLGLALTGMPVLFSEAPWARRLARVLGGFAVTHTMHRVFATIMIAVFVTHIARLVARVGIGKRPAFDRYAYWEKFDYWAVFWGMAIIGGSGLLLWFPETFSRIVPGWFFNIALLVHGEEALLAVGFIFTIHFFNSHLRPEKFPMDMVIFTGRVSHDELAHERPAEYARIAETAPDAGAPSARSWLIGRIIGTTAVVIGLTLVALILYAVASH